MCQNMQFTMNTLIHRDQKEARCSLQASRKRGVATLDKKRSKSPLFVCNVITSGRWTPHHGQMDVYQQPHVQYTSAR